jgi:hypothetical protein
MRAGHGWRYQPSKLVTISQMAFANVLIERNMELREPIPL